MSQLINFQLKSQIVHTVDSTKSEDVCYIVHMSESDKFIACAGSNNVIKLYNPTTHTLLSVLNQHKDSIHQTLFLNPTTLVTCSSDRTVKIFDCEKSTLVKSLNQKGEAFTIDIAGDLLAVGVGSSVCIWNLKTMKMVKEFCDSHTEDVTRVLFHPNDATKLFSCSVDGLICVYDLTVEDVDEAVLSVMNGEHSLNTIGFYGPSNEYLYSLSHTERLYTWDLASFSRITDFGGDLRTHLQEKYPDLQVNYFVTCQYDAANNALLLFGGNYSGLGLVYQVNSDAQQPSVVPIATLSNGHSDIIRSIYWNRTTNVILSAGEDGSLCFWSNQINFNNNNQSSSDSSSGKITKSNNARSKANPY
ncbi:WD40 repeat-containing protein [Cavenderia fasciculata]|uniref:WD40 repeat-containing protein n=1 Tax=Cavenderia fasciculata TaxID=261658 RepID=F4PRK8_CACFS|nr:WD40 repeat-containing protein [Cavenderia fasciculata]EGG21348.1 WD40 repeat-containing protein [Cavenderia fasciculata]|eukprot:XP_004359198.1 WD40 repeat-containing protein [Cavenderia fasciculata]